MKKNTSWQLATLCALALLTACGKQEAGDSKKSLSENKEAGSVITRNNTAEPQSLDPHQITGIPEINIIRDLFDGLVQTASRLHAFSDVGLGVVRRMRRDMAFDNAAAARDLDWNPRPYRPTESDFPAA